MASKITLSVGDHVRLPMRSLNEHESYQVTDNLVAPSHEPVDGLILSIREIKTGQLLTKTSGQQFDRYVIELLYDRTFSSRYASLVNAPRGSERPTATPRWQRVRAALRETCEQGLLYSTALPSLFTESPLAKYIDGWKVVKIRSAEFETLELVDTSAPAAG